MAGYSTNGQAIQGPGLGWNGDYYNTNTKQLQNTAPSYLNTNVLGASTGSGGSNGGNTGGNTGGQQPPMSNVPQPDNAAIDSAFSEANNYLNDLYNSTMSNKGNFMNTYTAPYESQRPMFEQAKNTGLNQIETQKTQAKQNSANVLDEARRLYSELVKGGTQRFGGTSSAGEFYQGYLGKQLMQNQGQIEGQLTNNMQALAAKAQEINDGYNANIKQLEIQLAGAKSQAETAFMNQINQINAMKAQTAQDKANAKLQALQNYRNTVASYQQQAYQAQQQLWLTTQQQTVQLANAAKQFSTNATTPANQVDYNQFSAYTPTQDNTQTTPSVTGYVNYNKKPMSTALPVLTDYNYQATA